MLNDEDILKLKSVFGTKDDIQAMEKKLVTEISNSENRMMSTLASKHEVQEVKSEVADLKELIQGLIVSSDSIAKSIGNLSLEYAAITSQLSRHELWIKQIAEKVGLSLSTE